MEFVSPETLRSLFNDGHYRTRLSEGQLQADIVNESHLVNPEAKSLPKCTVGQFLRYVDNHGQWFAEVYQYLKPDGTLGCSGMPDPKSIRQGGTIFALRRQFRAMPPTA